MQVHGRASNDLSSGRHLLGRSTQILCNVLKGLNHILGMCYNIGFSWVFAVMRELNIRRLLGVYSLLHAFESTFD